MKRYRIPNETILTLFPIEKIQSLNIVKWKNCLNYKWVYNGVVYKSRFSLQEMLFGERTHFLVYMGYNRKGTAEISIRYDDGEPANDETAFLQDYLEVLCKPQKERKKT